MFAPPRRGMPVKDKLCAVRRIAAPVAPIGVERLFEATLGRDPVETKHAGIHAPARGIENHVVGVARPAHHRVGGAMKGKLLRFAALRGHHEHIVVAISIRGERDPLAARDVSPRFSPDGKRIAFSSNRYGNYDVFVMPAEGGEPKQLTFHSAADTVVGWSRDSHYVIFNSARGRVYPGVLSLYL